MIPALTALASLGEGLVSAAPQAAQPSSTTFEEALGQVVSSSMDTLKSGEASAIQGLKGEAEPMKVVESVMEAQRSLQSMLAIRDKIVSAYQEVARMAI